MFGCSIMFDERRELPWITLCSFSKNLVFFRFLLYHKEHEEPLRTRQILLNRIVTVQECDATEV